MIKMWKKMSVSKKIFAGALAALLLSYVVLIIGQQFFFHKYYTYLLTQKLMSSVDGFSEEYAGWQSDDEINSGIIEYSDSGDFYIMVMGENGDLRHMVAYEMIITTETGEEIRLTLDNAIRSKQFQALELKKGDVVTVGCREPENSEHSRIYVPDRINSGGRVWMAAPVPLENNNRGAEEYKFINRTFTGEITSIALPSQQNAGIIIQRREAFAAAMDWRFRTDNFNITEEKYHYFYTNDETGNTYIVGMKRIEKNGDNEVVLAISPMRPVIEAVAVSKRMAGVWVFVGCFSAWIIAFFFTSFVSKPIMNMSAVTKKMCSLDFSERCRVTGEDEIGMLAQNINDMSEQLDITIAQLKRANEKLVEDIEHERMLENQRKEFVAAVSHELKTPLAVIQAYTEGIIDGISGENKARYLNVILDETKRMNALVLEMLENSRFEAGMQKLDIKEYDMNTVAQKISERFEKAFKDAEIEFVLDTDKKPVLRSFDAGLIDRVTANFITNAIFHTEKGGKIILKVSDGVLSVENTGSHIKNDELALIWDKFYKADKSRTRLGSGTGLGLSIAKNILNLHHAGYGVENTEIGVKFWYKIE